MYLTKSQIENLLSRDTDPLMVRPLLDSQQLGEISMDFRLGYDFLVSIHSRHSSIPASLEVSNIPISSFFQPTRRLLGESFLLHPNQTVLAVSLEYIRLPKNVFLDLTMRSSYARLGLSLSSMIQPGYCGCIPLELTNTNNNSVRLAVGARIFQARFYEIDENANYFAGSRKYKCQVRPEISSAQSDSDLQILKNVWLKDNKAN